MSWFFGEIIKDLHSKGHCEHEIAKQVPLAVSEVRLFLGINDMRMSFEQVRNQILRSNGNELKANIKKISSIM